MKKGTLLVLTSLIFNFWSYSQNCNLICNGNFETPFVVSSPYLLTQALIPCWKTTAPDGEMELWDNLFLSTTYSGTQLMELNANYSDKIVYQDFNVGAGLYLTIGFAHKGRAGIDSIRIELGPVNGPYTVLGSVGDDANLWGYYTYSFQAQNQGMYSLRFISIYNTPNISGIGNLLDSVTVCSSTVGINSIMGDKQYSISQKPNSSNIFIRYNGNNSAVGYLFNALGQKIWVKELNSLTSDYSIEGLSKGLYIFQIIEKGNAIISKKFLVE